ncbi:Uncharacterised protein [Lederbergia lenta]|uniref:Uncharacterized protein n=1 Tax=Lederbergia lenta TaxID=1467 RepID=A0A2X4WC44_LEDLE|nr:Uncharacterised protein [Lederbergia lenta]
MILLIGSFFDVLNQTLLATALALNFNVLLIAHLDLVDFYMYLLLRY